MYKFSKHVLLLFQPGICVDILSKLHDQLAESEEKDRIVVLMFDAMHIRPHLEYNAFSDCVSGVVHMDSETRSGEVAQSLLVFMLRSMFRGWTQLIGHHFTPSAFHQKDLRQLLDYYLSALDTAGLVCRAVVCDQEPSHVSMFREAGVSKDAPYIRCPSSGRKVFIIFDPPHLLKSTRNNLMTSDFLVSSRNTFAFIFTCYMFAFFYFCVYF